jgi:hypothetical protein
VNCGEGSADKALASQAWKMEGDRQSTELYHDFYMYAVVRHTLLSYTHTLFFFFSRVKTGVWGRESQQMGSGHM